MPRGLHADVEKGGVLKGWSVIPAKTPELWLHAVLALAMPLYAVGEEWLAIKPPKRFPCARGVPATPCKPNPVVTEVKGKAPPGFKKWDQTLSTVFQPLALAHYT